MKKNAIDDEIQIYIIFGAAVREDGSPSGTLKRRVTGAWTLANRVPQKAVFVVTGGQGKFGPPEAQVMKQILLDLGASESQIITENKATDTLQSAQYCYRALQQANLLGNPVTVCSSPYHNLRCQLLLKHYGINSKRGDMPSDRPALGWRKWLYYYFREAAAIPWDLMHCKFRQEASTRGNQ